MKHAAVGFRVHSGWAALIALTVTKGAPVVLFRERIHLVENFTYEFRQPYHTAEKLPLAEARAFVARVRSEARRLAHRAMRELKTDLRDQGYSLTGFGLLLSSGRPLPALKKILAAHSLIHSADGELFREALLHAAAHTGLKPMAVRERDLTDSASRVLRRKPEDLVQRISDLGRPLGPPWSQDEKLASLVAWLAASARPSTSHLSQGRKSR
ncbi:MAG: hypothetical protein WCC03_19420 [Candidatus Acidiferrales bacterium]